MLTVLPLGIFGSVVLFDLGAIVSGVALFDQVAHWDMAAGLLVGLTVLTVLLVDLTTALSGTAAQRALGVVSSATAGMVILFGVVWWVREDDGLSGDVGLFLLELVALAVGGTGVWFARRLIASAPTPAATRAPARREHGLGLGDL
jgi:hypothetical protein